MKKMKKQKNGKHFTFYYYFNNLQEKKQKSMKYKIIKKLAEEKTIETIINNIAKTNDDTLQDLAQMLYLDLLEKKDETIITLYEEKKLQYFLTRMVINSINSKTSRYYYLYKKYNDITDEIENERQNRKY